MVRIKKINLSLSFLIFIISSTTHKTLAGNNSLYYPHLILIGDTKASATIVSRRLTYPK